MFLSSWCLSTIKKKIQGEKVVYLMTMLDDTDISNIYLQTQIMLNSCPASFMLDQQQVQELIKLGRHMRNPVSSGSPGHW